MVRCVRAVDRSLRRRYFVFCRLSCPHTYFVLENSTRRKAAGRSTLYHGVRPRSLSSVGVSSACPKPGGPEEGTQQMWRRAAVSTRGEGGGETPPPPALRRPYATSSPRWRRQPGGTPRHLCRYLLAFAYCTTHNT